MDKIMAVIVTMVAVVAISAVVIFGDGGLAKSIEGKGDAVVSNLDGLDYNGGL